jgi:hypothetical protein
LATLQNERGPGDVVAYGLRMPEGVHEALALWRSHPERAFMFMGHDKVDCFFALSSQHRGAVDSIYWVVVLPMCGDEELLRWCEVHLTICGQYHRYAVPVLPEELLFAVEHTLHWATPPGALSAVRARRDAERPA